MSNSSATGQRVFPRSSLETAGVAEELLSFFPRSERYQPVAAGASNGRPRKGGQAIVFAAIDGHTGKHVAIKRLLAEEGISPGQQRVAEERLGREGAALHRFSGLRGIPDYLDLVKDADGDYLVQQWIEGKNLQELAVERPGDAVAFWCRLILQAAMIVKKVHQHKTIHRDLKPGNLLYRESDGAVFLIDFGIGLSKSTRPGRTSDTGDLTSLGCGNLGTVGYQAPEQIRNPSSVSYAADVYSLGKTLQFLICHNVDGAALTASSLFPSELSKFISEATSESVQGRIQKMDEFADRLSGLIQSGLLNNEQGVPSDAEPLNTLREEFPSARQVEQKILQGLERRLRDLENQVDEAVEYLESGKPDLAMEVLRQIPKELRSQRWHECYLNSQTAIRSCQKLLKMLDTNDDPVVILTEMAWQQQFVTGACIDEVLKRLQSLYQGLRIQQTPPKIRTQCFLKDEANAYRQAWSEYLQVPPAITVAGLDFQLIPPGEYLMGPPRAALDNTQDDLQHYVMLTRPIYVQVDPINQEEWTSLRTQPGIVQNDQIPWRNRPHPVAEDQADWAVYLPWEDCRDLCRTLAAHKDLLGFQTAAGIVNPLRARMLTEAEWEWCFRAGRSYEDAAVSTDHATESADNSFGLRFDRDIREWVSDCYDPHYYFHSTRQDPVGPANGRKRVRRSVPQHKHDRGCWPADVCNGEDHLTGFRVALEIVPTTDRN